MKTFICSLLLLASSSVFSAEIIKIIDGSSATCNNLVDFIQLQTSGAYRPLSYNRVDGKSILSLEFYRCVKTDDGYVFKKSNTLEGSYTTTVQSGIGNTKREVIIERKEPMVVAYNMTGRVLARSTALRNRGGAYVAELNFDENELESTFTGLRFDFSLYTMVIIKDKKTGEIIDSGKKFYGAYALIVR
jgi:hypothetical protein